LSNAVKSLPPSGQFGHDVYASWRRSSLGEITETLERQLILEMAGRLEGLSVLDVGCGDGTLALAASQYGPHRVAGCDPDARMVARDDAAVTWCCEQM
jgi:2-polyprenyl-3-methyl-5-hydroxy-6-metoxy-1,4-benzoquinol methylase